MTRRSLQPLREKFQADSAAALGSTAPAFGDTAAAARRLRHCAL